MSETTPVTSKLADWPTYFYEGAKSQLSSLGQKIYPLGEPLFDSIYNVFDFVYPKNPITDYRELWYLPTSIEVLIGSANYLSSCASQGGKLADEETQEKIRDIVQNISEKAQRPDQKFKYEVTVLDNKVINAWAMPGGKLAYNSGLYDKIEDLDLSEWKGLTHADVHAAGLGHEVAHSAIGHTRKRLEKTLFIQVALIVSQFAANIFINTKEREAAKEAQKDHDIESRTEKVQNLQKYDGYRRIIQIAFDFFAKIATDLYMLMDSRNAEYEADKYGIKLAYEAGYDVRGALALQKLFIAEKGHSHQTDSFVGKTLEWMSTHPKSEKRLEECQKEIDQIFKAKKNFKKS